MLLGAGWTMDAQHAAHIAAAPRRRLMSGIEELRKVLHDWQPRSSAPAPLALWQPVPRKLLPAAVAVADALQAALPRREAWQDFRLELAHSACARACANLRCAELGREGGPAPQAGGLRCSSCREAFYW